MSPHSGSEIADILDAIPGWAGTSRVIEPLEGGITNRNYRVVIGDERYVVRIRGAETHLLGVNPDVEHEASLLAASVGVGPEVIAYMASKQMLVTRFIDGVPLSEAVIHQSPTLSRIAESLLKVHGAGRLDVAFSPFRQVEAYERTARQRGVPVPAAYKLAHLAAQQIESSLPPLRFCFSHNDMNTANFIDDGTTIRIVDWEYAAMSNEYFDLGSFASEHQLVEAEEWSLLSAYFEGPTAADHARLRLMRFMADFDSATWAVLQQGISSLDFDFKAYAAEYFDRLLTVSASGILGTWLHECVG